MLVISPTESSACASTSEHSELSRRDDISHAVAALHVTISEDIPGQAAEKGAYLKGKVQELADQFPDLYDEVRGLGMLIGMQFRSPEVGYAVSSGLFSAGVLVGGTLNNAQTFRLEPPAVISYGQIDQVIDRLGGVLEDVRADVAGDRLATVH